MEILRKPICFTGSIQYYIIRINSVFNRSSKALKIDSCNRVANAKLYFNRATTSYKLDKPEDVIDNCDKALELDPTYTKALLRRAKTFMEAEKFEDAVRDYEKLVSGDARNREFR